MCLSECYAVLRGCDFKCAEYGETAPSVTDVLHFLQYAPCSMRPAEHNICVHISHEVAPPPPAPTVLCCTSCRASRRQYTRSDENLVHLVQCRYGTNRPFTRLRRPILTLRRLRELAAKRVDKLTDKPDCTEHGQTVV